MMKDKIWKDIKFFAGVMKDLPISRSLALGDEGFCVYTGTSAENWVYYPYDVRDSKTPERVSGFFRECGDDVSFLWFMYGEGEKYMAGSGLLYAGDLRAMSLCPSEIAMRPSNPDVIISPSKSPETWAATVWCGFGGNRDETPSGYTDFAEALSNEKRVSLYTAGTEGITAGTFLITNEPDVTGVYYFAVDPAFRRRGIALSMMNEICRLSEGKTIVLQATPSGVPFYKNFGFNDLFPIHVYSNTEDIF